MVREQGWTPRSLIERYPNGVRAERFTLPTRLATIFMNFFGIAAMTFGGVVIFGALITGVGSLISTLYPLPQSPPVKRQTEINYSSLSYAGGTRVLTAMYTDPNTGGKGADTAVALDGLQAGVLESSHGSLVQRTDISLARYPGRELLIRFDDKKLIVIVRAYLVGPHVYMFSATVPVGYERDPDVAKFFDSIHLGGL